MPSNTNRENKSNSKTNLGCLFFILLPLLYLQVIYPFIEAANGCPNGGPKSATPKSIARPAFDCTTYGEAHIVGLVIGICVSAYLIYTRIKKGQSLKLDNRSSTKKQRANFWAVVFVAGGTGFFLNLIFGIGFSISREIGTFLVITPIGLMGGLSLGVLVLVLMELIVWKKSVNGNSQI